jgi:hypothetical protein
MATKRRKLAKTVHMMNPETGQYESFLGGTTPPKWVADQITNKKAWEVGSGEPAAFARTGGLAAMTEEDKREAAASNSTDLLEDLEEIDEDDEDDDDDMEEFEEGSPRSSLEARTIPQLRQLAEQRGVDVEGLKLKGEIIDALMADAG